METKSILKKISRFKCCDTRFYPYIEKTLNRLPEEIYTNEIFNDLNFEIISFDPDESAGVFYPLSNQIAKLIILNISILKEPEYQIIHTIAHEISHKVIGKGETGLHEKEAEDLLVKWGFQEEVEKVDYRKTWLEDSGYKVGYEWAEKQKDLSQFEEFYDEWNEGKLDSDRWDELFWMILREVQQKSERLYDNRIHKLTWEYSEKYPGIKAFVEAIMGIGELLEELNQKEGEKE